jgi:subfamily B ATP-binding cassette protein MsbA
MSTHVPPPPTKLKLTDHGSMTLIRRLTRESLKPYWPVLLLAFLCMVVVAATGAAPAWLLQNVVDRVFVAKDPRYLWPAGVAVFLMFLGKSVASYIQEVLLAYVGQHIISDTQNRLFRHLINQDVSLFQATNSGSLVSHFTYDINAMRDAVSNALVGIGRDALSVIILVALAFYQDWELAAVSLVVTPISIYPIQLLARKMRRVARATQVEMGGLTNMLGQAFQAVRVIKAYRLEEFEEQRVRRTTAGLNKLAVSAAKAGAAAQPIIDTFGGLAITAVIVYGGARVIEGVTSSGAFFSFIAAILMAYQPMRSLSKVNVSLQTGLAASQRIFAILDKPPVLVDALNPKALPRAAADVSFEGVDFTYDGEEPVLSGLDFTASAGKITALVGPSGAGKSTVLNLIPRFYDPSSGRVTIGGMDLKELSLASLRDAIALVSQEVVLFDDTILNNIRCGRLSASDEEVREAAKLAAALEFIDRLPEDMNTLVGEHGTRLSGGQRQRIAIARALLKDAPILLLDEATSALDTESERQIQEALSRLMKGRTTLVIAHRLSTVRDADTIHVFSRGRVVESGDHDRLYEKGGLYARLYDMQFASNSDEQQLTQ